MSEPRFRIGPEIVHEAVDGEVIAIDLANGSYYSLAGSGPLVWELLGHGVTVTEATEALAARFDGEEGEIGEAVTKLLDDLREHTLIFAVEEESSGPPPAASNGDRPPFESRRFEPYDDMKDYFLLDPIHEVDTTGWPRPAA